MGKTFKHGTLESAFREQLWILPCWSQGFMKEMVIYRTESSHLPAQFCLKLGAYPQANGYASLERNTRVAWGIKAPSMGTIP